MVRILGCVIACVCATFGAAHAGQTEDTSTVLAWSRDGSSVLLVKESVHGSSAVTEVSRAYTIASAAGGQTTVELTDTLGTGVESISVEACTKASKQLAKELAARGFTRISVSAAACSGPDRDVVKVSVAVGDPGWVPLPQGRPPSAIELAAWDLVKRAVPTYRPFLPSPACDDPSTLESAVDVATKTGALVVVMEAQSPCEARRHTVVHLFRKTAVGYDGA